MVQNEYETIQSIHLELAIFKKVIGLSMACISLLLILDLFYFKDYSSVVIESIGMLTMTVFVILSQNEKWLSKLIIPFILFNFIILNLGWYVGGGFNTGIALLYLITVCVSILIIPRELRRSLIGAIAMNLVFMAILEFNNPEIREFMKGSTSELIASYILIIICYQLVIFLLFYAKDNFEQTRQFTFEQNKLHDEQAQELRELNLKLSTMNENLGFMVMEKTRELEDYNRKLLSFAAANLQKVTDPVVHIRELAGEYNSSASHEDIKKSIRELKRTAKILDMEVRLMNMKLEKEELE